MSEQIKKRGNKEIWKYGKQFSKDNQPTIRTKRESLLNKVLKSGCSESELIEIMKVQVNNALSGDLNSAKFVYDYMIGKTQLMQINDSDNDLNTLIQQNITNVFNSPQTVSNESLLNMLNNTVETIEINEV